MPDTICKPPAHGNSPFRDWTVMMFSRLLMVGHALGEGETALSLRIVQE
jgi:hypothetical protein